VWPKGLEGAKGVEVAKVAKVARVTNWDLPGRSFRCGISRSGPVRAGRVRPARPWFPRPNWGSAAA
jgi:hypothetical protein